MRTVTTTIIIFVLALAGCDRTDSQNLTPEQERQRIAAHQATIATCERLLGRPLIDSEKNCIHEGYSDGRLIGNIVPPLSETLKAKQAELNEQQMQKHGG